ncbi:MAG: hypothetical protein C9356_12215 [Oleiphilus sp.]|nr:MAG: hypothetical protein C9356_12215 [Oleiphilus sp.]
MKTIHLVAFLGILASVSVFNLLVGELNSKELTEEQKAWNELMSNEYDQVGEHEVFVPEN